MEPGRSSIARICSWFARMCGSCTGPSDSTETFILRSLLAKFDALVIKKYSERFGPVGDVQTQESAQQTMASHPKCSCASCAITASGWTVAGEYVDTGIGR